MPGIVGNLNFTYFDLRDFEETALDNAPQKRPHALQGPFARAPAPAAFRQRQQLARQAVLQRTPPPHRTGEVKTGGKKIIDRRHPGSLLENIIATLETEDVLRRLPNAKNYGSTRDEQLFNVGLELVITWVNRLLFLKLLESQLLSYYVPRQARRRRRRHRRKARTASTA